MQRRAQNKFLWSTVTGRFRECTGHRPSTLSCSLMTFSWTCDRSDASPPQPPGKVSAGDRTFGVACLPPRSSHFPSWSERSHETERYTCQNQTARGWHSHREININKKTSRGNTSHGGRLTTRRSRMQLLKIKSIKNTVI